MRAIVAMLACVGCGFHLELGAASGDDVRDDAAPGDGSDDAMPDAPGTVARSCTLALGSDHTCVLRADGTVWCWGQNGFGELGQGMVSSYSVTALQVQLGAAATSFASKSYHACAGLSNGTVKCWGINDANQIGDGLAGNRSSPATVVGLTDVAQVAVGRSHSCARKTNGAVTCWGSNTSGQLGDGTFVFKTTPTTTVMGLTASPVTLALASSHGCALLPGGVGQCWGANSFRQLGDGTTTDRSTATTMPVSDIAQIAPSGYSVPPYTGGSTCVLTTADTVSCWGSNDFGQLGNGNTSTTTTSTPVLVANLTNAAEIVSGRYHVCVRERTGTVACWGRNEYGQIGDGTNNTRTSPFTVPLPRPAVHIGAGGYHTCALLDDDSLYCWGANGAGQLGDGSTTSRTAPVASQSVCQ